MESTLYIGALLAVALIAGLAIFSGSQLKGGSEENNNNSGVVAGLIMGTLVGGSSTIGTAQLAYHYGMSAWWFTLGAGIACLIQALLYATPLRKFKCRTLIGILRQEYGEKVGMAASLLSSLGTFINILSQLLAASAVVLVIFPAAGDRWPLILSAVTMVLYVAFGGTKGAGIVGMLKLGLLCTAMLLCGFTAVRLFGGTSAIIPAVSHLCDETGVNYFSVLARGAGEDLGACLSLILGVLTTQTYAQALLSAGSDRQAKRGGFIAAFMIPPIGICGILVGLYMRTVTDPTVFSSKTALTNFVLEQLPAPVAGVVLGTLFIASVGTGAGLALGIATIIRCDILPCFVKREFGGKIQGLIIFIVLAAACLLSLGPIGDIILNFAFMSMGLRGAVLFFPLCCALWFRGKVAPQYVLGSVIVSPILVLLFGTVFSKLWPWDPLFIGVLCSLLIMGYGFAKRALWCRH